MDFIALDVETANSDISSICQIGIARFKDGQVVGEFVSLINPQDYFSPMNIGIDGIADASVEGAPTYPGHSIDTNTKPASGIKKALNGLVTSTCLPPNTMIPERIRPLTIGRKH